MVRLLDARSGSYAEVRPARPGLLRVCAHVPAPTGVTDTAWLRVPLVADLLFRTAELGGIQVLTLLAFAGRSATQMETFERAVGALGIHPPAAHASLPRRADDHDPATAGDVLAGPADPLAVRLALMSFLYHQPAELTKDVLTRADETIARWRRQVAEWAESPSRPMPALTSQAAGSAFGDLDTPSAPGVLREVIGDADVEAGAKFETFVYADRILGLDLPRDIGRIGR
jgi:hypothetical protein